MKKSNNIEKVISQNEKELSLIFENAPIIMMVLDKDRKIRKINKFGIDRTGKSIEEILFKEPGDIINCIFSLNNEGGCGFSENCQKCEARNSVIKTIENGDSFFKKEVEFKIEKDNKLVQYYYNFSSEILTYEPELLVLVSLDDITHSKITERALMFSEETFKLIFEATSNFVFKIDLMGIITDSNNQVRDLLGYEKYEIIGRKITKLFSDDSYKYFKENLYKIINEGILDNREISMKTKSGELLDVMINSVSLTDDHNVIFGRLFIINDITDIKIMNERLIESEERLHKLTQHIESVREEEKKRIAEIIHDGIGQSLTALKLTMRLLKDEITGTKNKFDEYFNDVIAITDDTIHKVRNISTELRPAILDHLGLVHAIYWQLEEFEKLTKVPTDFKHEPQKVILDNYSSTIIFRILQEALVNIARYAEASWVEVILRQNSELLYFSVSDNGKGITEKEANDPNAFGLMAIRERVHSIHGWIGIYGDPQEGTVIVIVVPLKKREEND